MPNEVVTVHNDNWDREVTRTAGLVLVYFWATWCGHCKMFAPTFEEISSEYEGKMKFARLNCDENADVAARCRIMGTPTLIIYKNGSEVEKIIGAAPKDIVMEKLEKILGSGGAR